MREAILSAQHRAAEEPDGRDEATDGGGEGEDFEARGVGGAGGWRAEVKRWGGSGEHVGQEEVAGGEHAADDGDEAEALEIVVGFGGAGVHGGECLVFRL